VIYMTRPRGRPIDEEIQQAVEAAIFHLKLANVSLVRAEVERLLKRTVGWDVIYRNLENLRGQNKIHKQIMADLGHRKAYVYLAD
jgi:hypothetical protein